MDQNNQELLEMREARRKRRKRNQIAAYVTVFLVIVLLGAGIAFGVRFLTKNAKDKAEVQQSQEAAVENLLANEEVIEISPEEPEEIPVELTPEQKLDEIVNAGIDAMPLEDKVAGLFLVTPEDITGVSTAVKAGDGTRDALAQYSVGGLIYFKKNMQSEEQLKEMLENTRNYSSYPLFLAVDEEGGAVSRVAEAGLADGVDSPKKIGETGDANNAYQAGVTVGTYLSGLGFNLNLAPVADLANVENSVMKDRSYGAEAAVVSPFVTSMLQGMEEQGVTGCLKHFPGIGSSVEDTHEGLVVTERTKEEFQEELAVFRAGIDAGAQMIMVGHLSAPGLKSDEDNKPNMPSSLSKAIVTEILRDELGYDGVIISDALNMAAITEYYAADEAAVLALKAGCDMLLMPEDFETAYNGVLQAVKDGVVSEERINDSLRRIYRIKYADKLES